MPSYTGTFANFFNGFPEALGDGTIDLDTDTLGVLLLTSTYTPDVTDAFVSDLTNEVSGNGYARQDLTGVTWPSSSGTASLDANNPSWTASGGSIVARYWVLYDNQTGADSTRNVIAYGLLDNTPADVTATDGDTITLQWGSSIFTLG